MNDGMNMEALKGDKFEDLEHQPETPAGGTPPAALKFGDEGYVLQPGDEGYVAPAAEPKFGEEGYVLKPGDEGYVAPKDAPAAAPDANAEAQKKATEDLLKKFNVKSLEELEERLKTPETPEEIQKRTEQIEKLVDQHVIASGRMSLQEVAALKNMRTVEPGLLVKGEFEKNYLVANKDANKEEVDQQFRLFYNLDSTDEKLKQLGEQRIKDEADRMIGAQQSKYDEAKKDFETIASEKARIPEFKTAVQSALKTALPAKIVLFTPEGGEPVEMEVSDDDRKEVEMFLVKNKFGSFLESTKDTPIGKELEDAAQGYMKIKYDQQRLQKVFEAGKKLGIKEGSATGARNSFEMQQPKIDEVQVNEELKKSDDKARTFFGN